MEQARGDESEFEESNIKSDQREGRVDLKMEVRYKLRSGRVTGAR